MDHKCANPTMRLEVDELILDYLVFTATKEIIVDFERQGELYEQPEMMNKSDMLLQLVDGKQSNFETCMFSFFLTVYSAFLAIFQQLHPSQPGSSALRFRLRLLRFIVVFTKRNALMTTTPSASALGILRKKRREQASAFRSNDGSMARLHSPHLTTHLASSDPIQIKQEQVILGKTSKPRGQLPDLQVANESNPPSMSLLDTLPLFMALSASQNALQSTNITKTWMQLAAGYMAQAFIEQHLVYGSQRPEILQDCFAWGFDAECGAEEESEEWQVNAMFWDEDGPVPDWDPIRDEHIHAVRKTAMLIDAATDYGINSAHSPRGCGYARTSTNADRRRSLDRQVRGPCL